ncbi:unnamed protein product, partial [Amoebophrya sp. A25]
EGSSSSSSLPPHFRNDIRFCANPQLFFRALLRQTANLWATVMTDVLDSANGLSAYLDTALEQFL